MIFTVDRIEENVVVLETEDEKTVTVARAQLPTVKAGDVLRLTAGVYTVDAKETERRRAEIFALEQRLLQKSRH